MRNEFSHLSRTGELAALIIDRLDRFNGRTTKRKLERSMSAHKRKLWKEAWEMLVQRKCIQLTAGKRRQVIVTQIDIPDWSLPRPVVKKRRRKRPQSEWFKFWLPVFLDRDGYEEKAAEANAALEGKWRRNLEDYGSG